jgi:CheY-like chemotaxis protein
MILMDIMMPGMCGTEVAEKLLLDSRTKHIPIIFMTAVVQKNEVEDKAGISDLREKFPAIRFPLTNSFHKVKNTPELYQVVL